MANMITAAAVKGIDSCPIEGFEKENVEKSFKLKYKKVSTFCNCSFWI